MDGHSRGSRRPLTAVDQHAESRRVESRTARGPARGVSVQRTRFGPDRYERTPLIMSTKTRTLQLSAITVASMFLCWSVAARAQGTTDPTPQLKVLRAAANALGQIRMSDIGVTNPPLPLVDVVTTMEITATGTVYTNGQPVTGTYTAAFAYIPQAMRVQIKPAGAGNPARTIHTVRDEYAWDESEPG